MTRKDTFISERGDWRQRRKGGPGAEGARRGGPGVQWRRWVQSHVGHCENFCFTSWEMSRYCGFEEVIASSDFCCHTIALDAVLRADCRATEGGGTWSRSRILLILDQDGGRGAQKSGRIPDIFLKGEADGKGGRWGVLERGSMDDAEGFAWAVGSCWQLRREDCGKSRLWGGLEED